MKHPALILAVAIIALSGCASQHTRGGLEARGNVSGAANHTASDMDSRRDVVLAVANPLDPPAIHAGSSLLGYASAGNYGAGQRAASTLAALKKHYGWHEVTGWSIKPLGVYCIVLEPPAGTSRDALIAALDRDPRVRLAQPLHDYAVYSSGHQTRATQAHRYNDPYVDLQIGFVQTNAARAHRVSEGGGVSVAIIDTGVDTGHPDLRGRIRSTRNEVDDDDAAFNRDAHGTEVAGIIAAIANNHVGIVGIAPQASIHAYKACWYPSASGGGARCNSFTLAKALAAVLNTDTRVVNLSLGGPADSLLGSLLEHLLGDGRIVVAAMPPDGNIGGFPDDVPGVIVVRSSATTPAYPGIISAPGQDILTTQPNGGFDFTSGSSMAAAHVSGIVALLLAIDPDLDRRTVHDLLLHSSKDTDGMFQVDAASAVARLERGMGHSPARNAESIGKGTSPGANPGDAGAREPPCSASGDGLKRARPMPCRQPGATLPGRTGKGP